MAKLLDEIHPGEILLEDFMKPMGVSARKLAADIDVSPSRISELVNGQRPITADTALRLGSFFGMEARFWLNLQSEYDIRVAEPRTSSKAFAQDPRFSADRGVTAGSHGDAPLIPREVQAHLPMQHRRISSGRRCTWFRKS